jgi:hypothetical protein
VNLEGLNSLSKKSIFLTETSHFLPQREAGDSGGAISFLLSQKCTKTLVFKGHSSLAKQAIYLTESTQFSSQRETRDSGGALSSLLPKKSRKPVNLDVHNSLSKKNNLPWWNKPIFAPARGRGFWRRAFSSPFRRFHKNCAFERSRYPSNTAIFLHETSLPQRKAGILEARFHFSFQIFPENL